MWPSGLQREARAAEPETHASSPSAVAGTRSDGPVVVVGITTESTQFWAAGLTDCSSLVTKCLEQAQKMQTSSAWLPK